MLRLFKRFAALLPVLALVGPPLQGTMIGDFSVFGHTGVSIGGSADS